MAQDVWGSLIAWYLFLAGAGAGAYLIAVVAGRLSGRYEPAANLAGGLSSSTAAVAAAGEAGVPSRKIGWQLLVKPGIYLGGPLVAVGSLLLLLDLGQPSKFILGYLRPGSSMISVGIWIITIFMICAFVQLLTVVIPRFSVSGRALRWLENAGAVFAVGTAVYTGLLLGVVKAIPFWNTPLLPVLFLISAVSTGIGAVILVAVLTSPRQELAEVVHNLGRVDLWLIILELLMLLFLLVVMAQGNVMAAASAQYLIGGNYALLFWLGVVVIGLVLPLGLELVMQRQNAVKLGAVAAICLLVGGICLRYAILAAGMTYPL